MREARRKEIRLFQLKGAGGRGQEAGIRGSAHDLPSSEDSDLTLTEGRGGHSHVTCKALVSYTDGGERARRPCKKSSVNPKKDSHVEGMALGTARDIHIYILLSKTTI